MAVRLNVVMVHPPAGLATAQRLSEGVVGELIGIAGIDLALVDPMEEIQAASTDYLTLNSLTSDVALLSWQPISEAIQLFSELGISGSRAAHAHDPEAPAVSSSRRIYGYDLHHFDTPQQVCAALSELLQSRQVRTYSLDTLSPKQPAAPVAETTIGTGPKAVKATESAAPQDVAEPTGGPASAGHIPTKPALDLDDLVDQLDWFDP